MNQTLNQTLNPVLTPAANNENPQLEALQAAVDDFLHAAVHDIRGPLGQVRALTVLLERQHKDSMDADGRELCGLIETASRRAVEVVESIYAYAQALEMPLFENADLNAIVDAAVFALNNEIDKTGAAITRDDLPCIRGDRAKLLVLFQELFCNSLKFRSGAPPRAHCSARTAPNGEAEVMISVVDNGVGVPEKQAKAIFKPLKRLHGQDYAGTGMGLAICCRIVELHGGNIWVEAHPEGGSAFRFTLAGTVRNPAGSGC